MSKIVKRIYYVICEGNSEENYIRELNKFFRENSVNCSFEPYNLKGIIPKTFSKIKEIYGKVLNEKINRSEEIIFWIDDDVFKREELNKQKIRECFNRLQGGNRVRFCYNYENFEDWLAMHLEEEAFLSYYDECNQRGHFEKPMSKKEYEPLIKKVMSFYEKSKLPNEFELNKNTLETALARNFSKKYKSKCDLAEIIGKILKEKNII
jgi:hypothetical protein